MTTAAKITYLAALIIGLLIGAYFGFDETTRALKIQREVVWITTPAMLDHFSYLQYKHADPEHARAALRTTIRFLEEMERSGPEGEQERDLAVAYTRAAMVEDAANDPEKSRDYMTKARDWWPPRGGRVLSDSEMKASLKTFEEMMERSQP